MAKTDNMPHKRVNAQEYDNKEHEFPDIPPIAPITPGKQKTMPDMAPVTNPDYHAPEGPMAPATAAPNYEHRYDGPIAPTVSVSDLYASFSNDDHLPSLPQNPEPHHEHHGPTLPTHAFEHEQSHENVFPDLPPVTAARPYNGPEIPTMNVNQLNEQFDMGMPTTYEHQFPSLPDEVPERNDDDRFPRLPDTKPGAPDTYLDITLPEDIGFGMEDKEDFSQGMGM